MNKSIYSDKRGVIEKLQSDNKYEIIAEVYKEGRLIAGLFSWKESGASE
ncbi:hypothetical protein [Halobacillus naozhouensis]|uniref:Uncharacterized protein n=1 Tax=Halobacillus naozhouensis TaxID=554880 RepID=A0ABY8J0B9_9BACI|nr:hypothetical protein [Halobacillus naozhouensis]WFT74889.1 hypothetical protein P9989_00165 [Halobacillus naozhouensis]